jgi:hypothetical protein
VIAGNLQVDPSHRDHFSLPDVAICVSLRGEIASPSFARQGCFHCPPPVGGGGEYSPPYHVGLGGSECGRPEHIRHHFLILFLVAAITIPFAVLVLDRELAGAFSPTDADRPLITSVRTPPSESAGRSCWEPGEGFNCCYRRRSCRTGCGFAILFP